MRTEVLRRIVVALLLAVSLTAVTACGPKTAPTSGTGTSTSQAAGTDQVRFAKTKFALHAGLAAGAIHRYLYKPYKAGTLQPGAKGRTKALVKAGLATAFSYHELKKAYGYAQADPALAKAIAPLQASVDGLQAMADRFKHGAFNPADAENADKLVSSLEADAGKDGVRVSDQDAPDQDIDRGQSSQP